MTITCQNCGKTHDIRIPFCPYCKAKLRALPGIGDSISKLRLPTHVANVLYFEKVKTIGDLYRLELRRGLRSVSGCGRWSVIEIELRLRENGYKTLTEVWRAMKGEDG